MSKNSALRIHYNPEFRAVFLTVGKKVEDTWKWETAKMKDHELGDIIRVLNNSSENVSFYHKFNDKETKIWINRKEENVFIKVNDFSKLLRPGEQMVLKILLQRIIIEDSQEEQWKKNNELQEENMTLMEFMM